MIKGRHRRAIAVVGAVLLVTLFHTRLSSLSSLAVNDPYPMYSALDPQEYLYTWEKLHLIGIPYERTESQHASIAISPFGQNAKVGRNMQNDAIPLGDLNGRWNMIGLLFGEIPTGQTLSPTLQRALENIFPGVEPGDIEHPAQYIDPAQQFGFFSIPLKYQKKGLRAQFQTKICGGCCGDFGFTLQVGGADICQYPSEVCLRLRPDNCEEVFVRDDGVCPPCTTCGLCYKMMPGFHNLTCCGTQEGCYPFQTNNDCNADTTVCPKLGTDECFNATNINKFLMQELKCIAPEIGLDISKFHEVRAEDTRAMIFWRHALYINKGLEGWPQFLFIPYFQAGGTIPTGGRRKPDEAFSLPFGNNGHYSIGGTMGIDLDFVHSIVFGAQSGFTHFFSRDVCDLRVPTSRCQSGIYPFTTNATVSPGMNWHFAGKIAAYHFLERLSWYFQYVVLHHEEDSIKLLTPDPAFKPEVLEHLSCFKTQFINTSLYYDISPNLTLGLLWQAPVTQRHAYRSTTILFSLWATF